MKKHEMSFRFMAEELAKRSARATTSFLSPADESLRRHLVSRFDRPAGNPDSFLADPVCEAMFPWEAATETFAQLAGPLLHPTTVNALASDFKPSDRPYRHQKRAWEVLLKEPGKSLMVTSGTGSGKTECFLVPILDDLIRESLSRGPLSGVEALFLYPLNALIDSQKTRLSAWCKPLEGKVRFGLYNGLTPDLVQKAERSGSPEQALDRATLRNNPPSLLVTNASMLEYVLVRPEDQPLIETSKGKLKWIVLDEAHTYVGSSAAEVALLLRRVMTAFGVSPSGVRFVATSATIGSDAASQVALQQYLADLAGVSPEQVEVLGGRRIVPALPPRGARATVQNVREAPQEARYAALTNCDAARSVREALTTNAAVKLSALTSAAGLPDGHATLELLDLCQLSRDQDRSFLPMRMHFFHRTQMGLWCCVNPSCAGKKGDDTLSGWSFGSLFTERRLHCTHCDSLVYELTLCRRCGEPHLAGFDTDANGEGQAICPEFAGPMSDENGIEAGEDGDDQDEDEEEAGATADRRYLHRPFEFSRKLDTFEEPKRIHRKSGLVGDTGSDSVEVHVLPEHRCIRCGARETQTFTPLTPVRIGAPFYLRTSVPVLLEQSAPDPEPLHKPMEGRRTLTFTDSRQGSAAFALSTQLESERNFIRSWLWHSLSRTKAGPADDLQALEQTIAILEKGNAPAHLIQPHREALSLAKNPPPPSLSWSQAATELADTSTVRAVIKENWRHRYAPVPQLEIAHTLLMRELMRRPQRTNSVETLGLAALDFPNLLANWPTEAKELGLSKTEWRDFLLIIIDHLIRNRWTLQIEDSVKEQWLGIQVRNYVLVAPGGEKHKEKSVFWPRPRSGNGHPNRFAVLLATATKTTIEDDRIGPALEAAWTSIQPVLTSVHDGYLLNLAVEARVVAVRKAWFCPITRRVLPVTLRGWSPYVAQDTKYGACQPIEMPAVRFPFGKDEKGQTRSSEDIRSWLESDEKIATLRQLGAWGDLHERFAYRPDVILVAEHSAQQPPSRLKRYTEAFKAGALNILSCSTTMEMGVDIGGLSTVAMNNAPPAPANFFQRAGRAGRRGESAAASLTMCKATPHGEAVFRDPTWPWTTKILPPRVALSSEPIIRRHLAALSLGRYLTGKPAHRLTMAWFFRPPAAGVPTHALLYLEWLSLPTTAATLHDGLALLVGRTPLQGKAADALLEMVAHDFQEVRAAWDAQDAASQQEVDTQTKAMVPGEKPSPALRAAMLVSKRLHGEYLLSELTQRCFLPVHGFPTGLASLVTITRKALERQESDDEGEKYYDFRGRNAFPTRDLPLAIREYAPGNSRIIDGKVYRSAGLTLNWQIPVGETSRRLRDCARQLAAAAELLQRVNVELNEPRHGACYWAPSPAGVPPRGRVSPGRRPFSGRGRAASVALVRA